MFITYFDYLTFQINISNSTGNSYNHNDICFKTTFDTTCRHRKLAIEIEIIS